MSIEVQHQRRSSDQWDWPLQHTDGVVELHSDGDKFEVALDAQYFTAKDIKVKVIGDILDIHFEHNYVTDQLGDVSRTVTRSYKLPEDVIPSTVKTTLEKGTLLITADKKK